MSYSIYGLSDRDFRQTHAITEGTLPDAGEAVTNRDARQAAALTEGVFPDAGDRITSNGVRNHQFTRG
jgi:hypothetical protein